MAKSNPSGRVVRPEKNGGTKVIRASTKRWSEAAEGRFLATLAETCNVKLASAAAGFSTVAIYNRWAKWPGFAADWAAAIEAGYARLEAGRVRLCECAAGAAALSLTDGAKSALSDRFARGLLLAFLLLRGIARRVRVGRFGVLFGPGAFTRRRNGLLFAFLGHGGSADQQDDDKAHDKFSSRIQTRAGRIGSRGGRMRGWWGVAIRVL